MDQQTYDALEACITKYEKAYTGAIALRLGSSKCALCTLFNKAPDPCKGCPVYERTGHPSCENTPYIELAYLSRQYQQDDPRVREVILEEIRFLKSLRSDRAPFGRQPKQVRVVVTGEDIDVDYWMRYLMKSAQYKGDDVSATSRHTFTIFPRAVND